MFLTGVGIPIMATLNSGLGQQLASPAAATFLLFGVGLLLAGLVLLTVGQPDWARLNFRQPWLFFGAAFILFYALAITWAGPKIGIGNAVFFVLLGQLMAAAAIDHYGWLGSIKSEITLQRIGGIAVMAIGVYLAKKSA
jgi:bacterial/archaeal transporter family-2 protein